MNTEELNNIKDSSTKEGANKQVICISRDLI